LERIVLVLLSLRPTLHIDYVAQAENVMPVGEICNRDVIILQRDETVLEAAKLMRHHHVGDVVVVEERDGRRIPVGIVTDRDVVVEIVATELDQGVITVGDIIGEDLATVKEDVAIFDAVQYMRSKAVRRLPVVDENGALVGILALDDLLELLSEELLAIAKLVNYQRQKEIRERH
jgi:CBS-domain-containing membrane protein